MYNVMFWYMYALWNDYHKLLNISTTSQCYFCVCDENTRSTLSKYQVCNKLLIVITMLYISLQSLFLL